MLNGVVRRTIAGTCILATFATQKDGDGNADKINLGFKPFDTCTPFDTTTKIHCRNPPTNIPVTPVKNRILSIYHQYCANIKQSTDHTIENNLPDCDGTDGTIAVHHTALQTNHYSKSTSDRPFENQLFENTAKWLERANTIFSNPYYKTSSIATTTETCPNKVQRNPGILNPKDYQAWKPPGLQISESFRQQSLSHYFKPSSQGFVTRNYGHTPSECLTAFFHGLTIATDAAILMACQYRAIETIIGTEEFNRIFDTPVSMFNIPCNIFTESLDNPALLDNEHKGLEPIDLANKIHSPFDDIRYIRNKSLFSWSAPHIAKLTEADIRQGDFLYIKGVENYSAKHKTGSSQGCSLICTGKNDSGQNLYLGFGRETMEEAKTYHQIKKILIDGYNKQQSSETEVAIEYGETAYAELSNHKVPDNHPIAGITNRNRFNFEKWQNIASLHSQSWYRQPLVPLPSTPKSVYNVTLLYPNHGNLADDFSSYDPSREQHKTMCLTLMKLTHAVIKSKNDASQQKPMGLFMTGTEVPGAIKTNLCLDVAKNAEKYGVKTLHIDAATVEQLLKQFIKNFTEYKDNIDKMLFDKDLIIFDNANNNELYTQLFLEAAMEYVITQKKTIIVNSEQPVNIKSAINHPINPATETAHNFVHLDLQSPTLADKLRLLRLREAPAAIIEHEQDVSIADIASALATHTDNIYHFKEGFDTTFFSTRSKVVFLEVNITGNFDKDLIFQLQQFFKLVNKVCFARCKGAKLILKTNNKQQFSELLKKYLDLMAIKDKAPIIYQLNHLFPDLIAPESVSTADNQPTKSTAGSYTIP